jgi:hypothetical protein
MGDKRVDAQSISASKSFITSRSAANISGVLFANPEMFQVSVSKSNSLQEMFQSGTS